MAPYELSLKACHGWPPRLRTALSSEVVEGNALVNFRFIILKWHSLAKHYPPSKILLLKFSVFLRANFLCLARPACSCSLQFSHFLKKKLLLAAAGVRGELLALAASSTFPAALRQRRNRSFLIQGRWFKGCDLSHCSLLWDLHKLLLKFPWWPRVSTLISCVVTGSAALALWSATGWGWGMLQQEGQCGAAWRTLHSAVCLAEATPGPSWESQSSFHQCPAALWSSSCECLMCHTSTHSFLCHVSRLMVPWALGLYWENYRRCNWRLHFG